MNQIQVVQQAEDIPRTNIKIFIPENDVKLCPETEADTGMSCLARR